MTGKDYSTIAVLRKVRVVGSRYHLQNPALTVAVSVNFIPSVKEYEKDFDFDVVAVVESSQLMDREMDWEPPMATLSQLMT